MLDSRNIILVSGTENKESLRKLALGLGKVLFLYVIDQDVLRDIPQYRFASMVSDTEEMLEDLENELWEKGVSAKTSIEWGDVVEKLSNARKLYEAREVAFIDTGSDICKRYKEKLRDLGWVKILSG